MQLTNEISFVIRCAMVKKKNYIEKFPNKFNPSHTLRCAVGFTHTGGM